MPFKKLARSVSKVVRQVASPVKQVAKKISGAKKIASNAMPINKAVEKVRDVAPLPGPIKDQMFRGPIDGAGEEREAKQARGLLGKLKGRRIGPFKFKEGGMADKTGRAMKKTTADAKGRAMTKAPKKMMGGGMAKGYAKGGDVTCGKATRGYGAARKGK